MRRTSPAAAAGAAEEATLLEPRHRRENGSADCGWKKCELLGGGKVVKPKVAFFSAAAV